MTDIRIPLVLVAEDDIDIRALIARSLRAGGYDVALAGDGEEALELAKVQAPQAAVLDIAMPGMDGYEVTRRLRAHGPTEAIPIVLVTAKASNGDAERGYAAGASEYITKPFSPRLLRDRLDVLLAR